MSERSVRSYQRTFGGGAPCKVVEIRADRLDVHRLQALSRIRARDAAHILSLQTGASVETLALPSLAVRASRAPDALRRHAHDTFPSLRSAVGAWWARTDPLGRQALLAGGARPRRDVQPRRDTSTTHDALPARDERPTSDTGEVGRFLATLRRRGVIASYQCLVAGDAPRLLAPIGTLGYLRQVGHLLPSALLCNTHFFIYDPRELDSPLAAIGDPVGMLASHGQIRAPPILRRATLTLAGGRWQVQHLGIDDVAIDLPDGTTVAPRSATQPASASVGPTLSFRGDHALEAGGAATATPACDVCIQGRHVSVIRMGSALSVPHGALVLSYAAAPNPALLRALEARPTVRFRIPRLPGLTTALQAGPQLLRGGELAVSAASFHEERFRTLGTPNPTAPLDFPADADRTRASRVGIGVTRANTLVIVAVQGTSSLSDVGPDAPTGCTLTELAQLLAEAGAVDALNCDGGGSSQVFAGPGVLLGSSDARAVPGALFDRPVPVAAAVR